MIFQRLYSGIKKRVYPSAFDLEYKRFIKDNGEALRTSYPLTANSVVWDVGGYKGEFASDLLKKYSCNVRVFEPIPDFTKIIEKKFAGNAKIKAFPFGLGGKDEVLEFGFSDNATSVFIAKNVVQAQVRDAANVYKELNEDVIDLMKINIEGGEYQLLDRMIDIGIISKVKNLQIQFHNFVPDAETLYTNLQEKLSKTHKKNWSYKFIWENWELK